MQRQVDVVLEPVGEISTDSRTRYIIAIEQRRKVERPSRVRAVPIAGLEYRTPRGRVQQAGHEVLEVGVRRRSQTERGQSSNRRACSGHPSRRHGPVFLKPT